jgi:hypothetical protein
VGCLFPERLGTKVDKVNSFGPKIGGVYLSFLQQPRGPKSIRDDFRKAI